MTINSVYELTMPIVKTVVAMVTLIGAINLFQAVKEILISRYAISAHEDVVRTALKTIRSAGKLVNPNHNEKVLRNLIHDINESKKMDDLVLEDMLLRIAELETRLGVGLQNDRNYLYSYYYSGTCTSRDGSYSRCIKRYRLVNFTKISNYFKMQWMQSSS